MYSVSSSPTPVLCLLHGTVFA